MFGNMRDEKVVLKKTLFSGLNHGVDEWMEVLIIRIENPG